MEGIGKFLLFQTFYSPLDPRASALWGSETICQMNNTSIHLHSSLEKQTQGR